MDRPFSLESIELHRIYSQQQFSCSPRTICNARGGWNRDTFESSTAVSHDKPGASTTFHIKKTTTILCVCPLPYHLLTPLHHSSRRLSFQIRQIFPDRSFQFFENTYGSSSSNFECTNWEWWTEQNCSFFDRIATWVHLEFIVFSSTFNTLQVYINAALVASCTVEQRRDLQNW